MIAALHIFRRIVMSQVMQIDRVLAPPADSDRPRVCDREIDGPVAWKATDLPDDAGRLAIPPDALAELDATLALLRANPLPVLALDPRDFELPHCRAMMARAKHELDEGVGFVVIDRLPLERMSRDEATALYWLLARMVARPVAQKWDGTMVYDVTDKGRPPGNGVRPDVTNADQNFHTDNSYNLCPPEYVALFCIQTAREGGINSVVSFASAHNEMRRRHPDLLPRLYRPYFFDRQREHAPDDRMVTWHPMFEHDGERLVGRLSRFQVMNGYPLAGAEIDAEGREALEAFESIMKDPALRRDFYFERGQIQIVANLLCGHKRTGFTDWPEPERKRHLVRLWLRDTGRAFYNG